MESSDRQHAPGTRTASGIPVSGGTAVGEAFVYGDILDEVELRRIRRDEVDGEIARFLEAVALVEQELTGDAERISHELGQDKADVFLVHSMILEDRVVIQSILDRVRNDLVNAEAAVADEMKRLAAVLSASEDDYLRDRSYDVTDTGKRVLERMLGVWAHCPILRPMVLVARELRASDTVTMDRGRILGFVTELGGKESHAAILARSLGVPAIVGAAGIVDRVRTGETVIVDGEAGRIIIDPPADVLDSYSAKRDEEERAAAELKPLIELPADTLDGTRITLLANVGSVEEAQHAARLKADGIGLFRTELVFMAAGSFLGEDEQFEIYRSAAQAMGGRPVTIRTLDLGGDKFVGPENPLREHNPYLGYRSVRALLDRSDLFAAQMSAVLRAGADADVRILWPMIASVDELRAVRAILEEAKSRLRARGLPFREDIPVGVMIEIPSAAIVADRLAAECDFLSIGTNDLVQYVLAVDRGNAYVDHLYRPHDPGVLALISAAIEGAGKLGKPIALCGEMGGEVEYVPLLIGLGIRELSVSPSRLLLTKKAIREVDGGRAASLAEEAIAAATASDVEALLGLAAGTKGARRPSSAGRA